MKLSELKANPKNPRKISPEKLEMLKRSLLEFGDLGGIILNRRTGQLVGGHQRRDALEEGSVIITQVFTEATATGTVAEGYVEIGSDRFNYREVDWDETREMAANIAANKGAGEWDMTKLSEMMSELSNLNFNLDLTMFDEIEREKLIEPKKVEGLIDDDEVPEVTESNSKLGDIYQLGAHRLMCGDSTSIDAVEKLMDGEKADLIHTDPPYNVDYSNQDRPKAGKKDLGRIKNDAMSDEDFCDFLKQSLTCAYVVAQENSSVYIWYASKETVNFHSAAAAAAGWNINQQIIWKKPMLLGRGRYQWAHEPCVFGVKGSPYFTEDRTKTTVWDFGGYDKSKNQHPTQKPVFLAEEAISNSTKNESAVLDLFGGSGSTLIACEKTNRKCFMMELDPHYCDVIVARWEKYTGKKASLV